MQNDTTTSGDPQPEQPDNGNKDDANTGSDDANTGGNGDSNDEDSKSDDKASV